MYFRSGDRIVEVNGTNIANENHQQVVQRIKAVSTMTRLLVVDTETDNYYRDKKIVIRGDMPNVLVGDSPDSNPANSPADAPVVNGGVNNTSMYTYRCSIFELLVYWSYSPIISLFCMCAKSTL